jgi:hypothetical protein
MLRCPGYIFKYLARSDDMLMQFFAFFHFLWYALLSTCIIDRPFLDVRHVGCEEVPLTPNDELQRGH